jgi:hypothetical protein
VALPFEFLTQVVLLDILNLTFFEVGYFLTLIDAISVVDPDLVPV